MFRAVVKLSLYLLFSLPAFGQENGCFGPSFVQILQDGLERDVRLTCVVPYPRTSGEFLVGGTVDGDLLLMRLDPAGNLRWRREFPLPSEGTDLSTLQQLLVDDRGTIAGVGSVFNSNVQRGYLFRYDPGEDRMRYFHRFDEASELNALYQFGNDYLTLGSRKALPSPLFSQAFAQRFDIETGLPNASGNIADLGGEERYTDAVALPDGRLAVTGNFGYTGGASSNRAVLLFLDAERRVGSAQLGPIRQNSNSRLYGHQLRVLNDKLYLLQWGDIDVLTGSENTAPLLSCFDLDGEHRWTKRYDVLDFAGESGINLSVHQNGLLIYGFSLPEAKRQTYLLRLDPEGNVDWSRSVDLPGNVKLYFRSGQQLHADDSQIVFAATLAFRNGRGQEGALVRLDPRGQTDNACTQLNELTVIAANYPSGWASVTVAESERDFTLSPLQTTPQDSPIAEFDDCDRPCVGCEERSFRTTLICPGDSAFLNGRWRKVAGIFTDTLISVTEACDSLVTEELLFTTPVVVEFTERRSCGVPEAAVTLRPSGGLPPYRFRWSDGVETDQLTRMLPAGAYFVTVTNALGCEPTVVAVEVSDAPQETVALSVEPPTCPGDSTASIVLEPAGVGELKLINDPTFTRDRRDGLAAGTYGLVLKGSVGCEVFRQITIPEPVPDRLNIVGEGTANPGKPYPLSALLRSGNANATISWSAPVIDACEGCGEASVVLLSDSTVYATATDANGCVTTASLSIRVVDAASDVYVPTAFSPNEDGVNDLFQPGLGFNVRRVVSLSVYDRWGGEIFAAEGTEASAWDGNERAAGTYLYQLTYELLDGRLRTRSGEVNLIR